MRHYRHLFIALLAAITAGSTQAQLPAFHGNPQHTGYSTAVGPNLAALKWKLNLGGAILSSPVLGPDGTIYLGSVLNDTKHPELFVTAVNPNGTIKWRFKTGYYDTQVPSSPALGPDGKIYVGAQDGYFYALNPDGTLAWRFQGNGPIQQHPVVAQDGTVYVGIDGRLHAFTSTGVLKWTTNLGDTALPGGPALSADENTIFASGYTSAGPVSTAYAFNRDGSLKWRDDSFYGYYPALCPPTVMPDGRVLFLSGGLFAMDPANGAFYWYYYPSGSYYNSYGSVCADPAGNVVYAFDRFVGKLRTEGTLAWQNELMAVGMEMRGKAPLALHSSTETETCTLASGRESVRPAIGARSCAPTPPRAKRSGTSRWVRERTPTRPRWPRMEPCTSAAWTAFSTLSETPPCPYFPLS